MTEYINTFWRKGMPEGDKVLKCDKEPVNYNGFLIYERAKGTVYDVVKDGACIGMYAGLNGAKRNIDLKSGRCLQEQGEFDNVLGRTDCKNTVCDLCATDDKQCSICGENVNYVNILYDSGAPFHKECYEIEYGRIDNLESS